MAAPVVSGPTVRTGASTRPDMVSRPVQKSCSHKCAASNDTFYSKTHLLHSFHWKGYQQDSDCGKHKCQVKDFCGYDKRVIRGNRCYCQHDF
jgi:hypothetical protein